MADKPMFFYVDVLHIQRADSRLALSQWLGANRESALHTWSINLKLHSCLALQLWGMKNATIHIDWLTSSLSIKLTKNMPLLRIPFANLVHLRLVHGLVITSHYFYVSVITHTYHTLNDGLALSIKLTFVFFCYLSFHMCGDFAKRARMN